MLKVNKSGFTIRNEIIYVQGSIEGKFKRYSTGKKATRLNLAWIKKNATSELKRIFQEKNTKSTIVTSFVEYAYLNLELKKNSLKENTFKEYMSQFEKCIKPFFLNYNLKDISRLDLKKWQHALVKSGKSGKTVNNYRAVLNGILEEARKDGLIEKNFFADIDKEKVIKPEITPFSLEEIKAIIDNADGWEKWFIQISFFTGIRTGELLALKWEDINFLSKQIHIKRAVRKGIVSEPKTESSIRSIDMLPVVEEAFNKLKFGSFMKNGYIFLDSSDDIFYDSSFIREGVWRRALKYAKLDYRSLYQTRHTFASLMISRGEDILWVSKTLGHSNLQTTLTRYAKFIQTEKTKRASFLDSVSFNKNNCTKTAHYENKEIKKA